MTSKLILDQPTRAYKPGDTISGHVELDTDRQNVYIILQGVAKTKVNPDGRCDKIIRRSRALLLYEIFPLHNDNGTSVPSANTTKGRTFAVTVPDQSVSVGKIPKPTGKRRSLRPYWTEEHRWHGRRWSGNRYYESYSGSPLPPSCHFQSRQGGLMSETRIEYSLVLATSSRTCNSEGDPTARLNGDDMSPEPASLARARMTELVVCPFWLRMGPINPATGSAKVTNEILRFRNLQQPSHDPSQVEESKIRKALMSVREGSFEVTIQRPEFVRAGSQVSISMDVRSAGSTRVECEAKHFMHDLFLTEIKVALRPVVGARAVSVTSTYESSWSGPIAAYSQCSASDRSYFAKWSPDDFYTQLKGNRPPDACERLHVPSIAPSSDLTLNVTLDKALPERLIPTFKTYNVHRRHIMYVLLKFKCGGEMQSLRLHFPVTVLPASEYGDQDWGSYNLLPEDQQLSKELTGWDVFDMADLVRTVGEEIMWSFLM